MEGLLHAYKVATIHKNQKQGEICQFIVFDIFPFLFLKLQEFYIFRKPNMNCNQRDCINLHTPPAPEPAPEPELTPTATNTSESSNSGQMVVCLQECTIQTEV